MPALVDVTVPDNIGTDVVYKAMSVNNGIASYRAVGVSTVRELQPSFTLAFQEPSKTSRLTKVRLKASWPVSKMIDSVKTPTGSFVSVDATFFLPVDSVKAERMDMFEFIRNGFSGAVPSLEAEIGDLLPTY